MAKPQHTAAPAADRPPVRPDDVMLFDLHRVPADGYGIEPEWWKRYLCFRLVMEHGSEASRRAPESQAKEIYRALDEENFGEQTP